MQLGHSHTGIGTRQRAKVAVLTAAERQAASLHLCVVSSAFLLSLLLLLGAGRLIGP